MLEFPRWKYALVIVLVIASVIYAIPNLYPQTPAVQVSATLNSTIDAALTERVKQALQAASIPYERVAQEGSSLMVRLPNAEVQLLAADLLRDELAERYVVAPVPCTSGSTCAAACTS